MATGKCSAMADGTLAISHGHNPVRGFSHCLAKAALVGTGDILPTLSSEAGPRQGSEFFPDCDGLAAVESGLG